MRIRKRYVALVLAVIFVGFVWVNNTNVFRSAQPRHRYLAHRGLAQTFDVSQVDWDTNTAEIIYEPEHPYLENTIASMQAAFDCGADVVEFDVKRTKDDALAVFHDSTLDYRTDGEGRVSDYTMEALRRLDIGYGYTADGGRTHPFRGKGVGLMPSIDEVFSAFRDEELLIHVKDGDMRTYEVLWGYLEGMSEARLAQITVYGDDEGIAYLRGQSASVCLLSMAMMKSALLAYELVGWSGYVPESLHNMELHLPLNYARFLWGWPTQFVRRMESVNTRVVVVAGDGSKSEGFDTEESLGAIPDGYAGYIWTNRIDRLTA